MNTKTLETIYYSATIIGLIFLYLYNHINPEYYLTYYALGIIIGMALMYTIQK